VPTKASAAPATAAARGRPKPNAQPRNGNCAPYVENPSVPIDALESLIERK
jgi:hypothetical protein